MGEGDGGEKEAKNGELLLQTTEWRNQGEKKKTKKGKNEEEKRRGRGGGGRELGGLNQCSACWM